MSPHTDKMPRGQQPAVDCAASALKTTYAAGVLHYNCPQSPLGVIVVSDPVPYCVVYQFVSKVEEIIFLSSFQTLNHMTCICHPSGIDATTSS